MIVEGLLEARDTLVVRDAERVELAPVPARAEPEHEAPLAHLVDRRRHLRQHARRVEARAGHERPEPHPLGHRRERGQQRERLPRPALRIVIEQVVAEPDRLEPDLLGRPRHREVLGPAHVALDLWELDADTHERET